jgi:hypothetical protein
MERLVEAIWDQTVFARDAPPAAWDLDTGRLRLRDGRQVVCEVDARNFNLHGDPNEALRVALLLPSGGLEQAGCDLAAWEAWDSTPGDSEGPRWVRELVGDLADLADAVYAREPFLGAMIAAEYVVTLQDLRRPEAFVGEPLPWTLLLPDGETGTLRRYPDRRS